MKRGTIILLLLWLSPVVKSQTVNFGDDFSDRDISNWNGHLSNFSFVEEVGNILLQLDADSAGTSYLSIPSNSITGYWEFFIRLGFSPSNNNYARIYLMSDRMDLTTEINGYMLQAGENRSEDVFRLFKITNGEKESEVLSGTTNISSGGDYRVKILHTAEGEWALWVGEGYTGLLREEASGNDNTYSTASHFGLLAKYTSSNTRKMAFDFKIDIPPLQIDTAYVVDNRHLDITFSRNIDPNSVQAEDFISTPGNVSPNIITHLSKDTLRIGFPEDLGSGFNNLLVSGIRDEAGESVLSDTSFSFVVYDDFQPGDVVINEFMKDPPEGASEYVELKNISGRYLNLKNWLLGDNNSLDLLSEKDLLLQPESFLVISPDISALTDYFGAGPYREVSLPSFNNGSDQVRVYLPDSTLVDSLAYDSEWGGVKTSLERRSARAPSFYSENWQDSTTALGGTPGLENQTTPDNIPPVISASEIVNSRNLRVAFNERLVRSYAEDLSNYRLVNMASSPAPEITSAIQIAKDTVSLSLNEPLEESFYDLIIFNQSDIFGNITEADTVRFEYVALSDPEPGNIAINEFMYDPGESYSEFIELYNPTDYNFSLAGFTINDNSGAARTITSGDYILRKNSYVVLFPDSTLIQTNPEFDYILTSLPALNNSEDAIVLKNESGQIIDSLSYTSGWGGKELSLERRTPSVSAVYKENWGDSPSPESATPGAENQIAPDTRAPDLLQTQAPDAKRILLQYDGSLDQETAINPANYNLSRANSVVGVEYSGNLVTLLLREDLINNTKYTISIGEQQDIFGNVAPLTTAEFRYLEFSAARYMNVVFNEILYRRADELSPEFVELYNPTEKNLDLSGWIFKDGSSTECVLPEGTQLASGEYLVLTDRPEFASSPNTVYLNNFPTLNDNGDALILKDSTGTLIDSLYYRKIWGGDEPGISLERKDPQAASGDASNWYSSENSHSAGIQNSVFQEDEVPPVVIFAAQQKQGIFVVFEEFIRLEGDTGFELDGTKIKSFSFDSTRGNELMLYPDGKEFNELRISNLDDFKGNRTASVSIPVAQPLTPGELVINEILYDPLADPDDNLPDQTEYIEVYNRSSHAISLEGLVLHDEPDEDQEIRIIEPVSTRYRWIPAGGYLLIYAEDETEVFEESQLAGYFALEGMDAGAVLQVGRSSLSLGSSGDAIYLADSTGTVIDSVFYDESWQNPNRYDTKGVALERIDPEGPANESSNWSSSTDVRGGTPGETNSIFQQPDAAPESTGLSFSPNPFSPDEDGFEDNLFINYKLDEADYLLRIRIFDRYGRQVRKLSDGHSAGFEGAILWDGLTDDRRKNRVGIYIVLFEAYNSATGKNRTFKETVVLARKF